MTDSDKSAELRHWLGLGGQRLMRRVGGAEVFDVSGPTRARATAVGYKVGVSGVLDPRLALSAKERAIGNCYGAYFEQAHTGGSSEFLREFVDGGGAAGGGYSERQAHIVSMVAEAQLALKKAKAIRYKKPKKRAATNGKPATRPGRFLPIPAAELIDAVCVYGHSVEAVAIRYQWFTIEKRPKSEDKCKTQWRPRQHIAAGIKDALIVVSEAWAEAGMNVPYQFGTIEVE